MRKEEMFTKEDEVIEDRVGVRMPMNLQFFAETKDDSEDDDDSEEDNSDSEDDDTSENEDDDNKCGEEKKFTQKQVTGMMAREKKQGKNSVYKELGINPKDSKMVQAVKDYIASQKSEEDKTAEKDAEVQKAEQRAMIAEAKAEAMVLGVKPKYVEDIITLVLSKMADDESSDLKTIIGEFKTKYPAWFGQSDSDDDKAGKKTGQKGTGSSMKGKSKDGKGSEKGMGARLAAQRKTSPKKSSYWGQ